MALIKVLNTRIMKRLLPLPLLFLFLAALPCSAFDLPKGFFTLSELDTARAEAVEKPEMVGFLITNPAMQPT